MEHPDDETKNPVEGGRGEGRATLIVGKGPEEEAWGDFQNGIFTLWMVASLAFDCERFLLLSKNVDFGEKTEFRIEQILLWGELQERSRQGRCF